MKMKGYGWNNLHAVTQNFYTLFGKVVCRWNWPTHCSYGNHLVVKMTIIYSLSLIVLRVRIFLQYSQTHSHWVLDSLSQIVPYIVVPGEVGKRGSPSKGRGGRGITADSQRELDNRCDYDNVHRSCWWWVRWQSCDRVVRGRRKVVTLGLRMRDKNCLETVLYHN